MSARSPKDIAALASAQGAEDTRSFPSRNPRSVSVGREHTDSQEDLTAFAGAQGAEHGLVAFVAENRLEGGLT